VAVLNDADRAGALADLPGWTFDAERQGIAKRFTFAGFGEAFAFMTRIAFEAEKADHHPEWTNVWNRVDILLSTHSAGGVTSKDIALAHKIEAAAG